jgi:hypothetical protein
MTPQHYRIHANEDVLQWCARWLTSASWRTSEQAMSLCLLYFNLSRYVIRLPVKGQTPVETLSDARKALHVLRQLIGELELEEARSKMDFPISARAIEPAHLSVLHAQRGGENEPA